MHRESVMEKVRPVIELRQPLVGMPSTGPTVRSGGAGQRTPPRDRSQAPDSQAWTGNGLAERDNRRVMDSGGTKSTSLDSVGRKHVTATLPKVRVVGLRVSIYYVTRYRF
jgi:hypothetical protein